MRHSKCNIRLLFGTVIWNWKVLDKRRSSNTEVKFIIGSEQIQAVRLVDILGMTIGNKLNFNLHIDCTLHINLQINSTYLLG